MPDGIVPQTGICKMHVIEEHEATNQRSPLAAQCRVASLVNARKRHVNRCVSDATETVIRLGLS
jgi:hypothetical protein